MATTASPPGGFVPRFHPRILGSAAPVFPGFEVDILDRVPDSEREDAVWHRERAKAMIKAHPEIKELFGNDRSTAFWCPDIWCSGWTRSASHRQTVWS